jgi:hypothetical protein
VFDTLLRPSEADRLQETGNSKTKALAIYLRKMLIGNRQDEMLYVSGMNLRSYVEATCSWSCGQTDRFPLLSKFCSAVAVLPISAA